MNNFDSFFDNLLPLRPLFPFVQSVLPTVFDDSLSYLETLGKVVKALNDTESNVNTLEQAVRAFADDLALYGNLTISPVEITFNQGTGSYSASMPYDDIVPAIEEGHTMVMHVVDDLHDVEYYTATMKVTETGNGVKVLYWESPAFTVNDVTVFYEAFINENDVAGVTVRTITGGSDAFIIHYDSETETADKTFAEIVAAMEAEKGVMLIADNFFISNARWTTSGNDVDGYEVISVQFNAFNVLTVQSGKSLGCVTYAVDDNNTWTVSRNGFPNESRVNALIDVAIRQLEGFNSIVKLDYNETTGAVTYWDGEQTINASGQYISNNLVDSVLPQMIILEGIEQHGVGMQTVNTYLLAEYGQTTGAWFIDFYRVYNGNIETVRIPWGSNIAVKTVTPIPTMEDTFRACNGLKYGADPTGQNDSSAAINACLNAEGYCSLPRGTYKTTSPIIMDGFRDELLVDGRIIYTGDDAAIYVKNGFCHIELDTLYSTGKGVVLESTSNVYTSGLAGYGVFNINHIKSTKQCIVLDSRAGGIHYNTFTGNSLWANTDTYGNSTADRTYNCIEIVNASPYWNSRNIFNGYAVCFALNGILIDGGNRGLCYGNAFNDFSFEHCTNNFNANHFMNTILSNAAMQEKADNTKCLILADFGKGNKFSFTELLIERIDVDITGLSETARVDIDGSLISDQGTVLANSFVISAYGSYCKEPGMTPLRVNAIANRRYVNPLNSLHFYGYGDTGTITLPAYIGAGNYREHEFYYTHLATNAITLVDAAGNTALTIAGGTGSNKTYHCIFVQGIGWK